MAAAKGRGHGTKWTPDQECLGTTATHPPHHVAEELEGFSEREET